MVTDQRDTPAPKTRRSFDDIHTGAVVTNKVEIHCRKAFDAVTQVSRHGQSLEKDLGQDHSRTHIEENASLETRYKSNQGFEVAMTGGAERGSISTRMHVVYVGPDRGMNGDGNPEPDR